MSIPARVELRVVALDEIFLGTARPSVITVLRSLATRGLVTRDGDSWLLSHLSRHALSAR